MRCTSLRSRAVVRTSAHVAEREVAEPAVDQLRGAARGAGGEVARLDEGDAQAAARRLARDARAADPAADHREVEASPPRAASSVCSRARASRAGRHGRCMRRDAQRFASAPSSQRARAKSAAGVRVGERGVDALVGAEAHAARCGRSAGRRGAPGRRASPARCAARACPSRSRRPGGARARARSFTPDHLEQVLGLGRQRAVAVEELVADALHVGLVGRAGEALVEHQALAHLRHVGLGQLRGHGQADLGIDSTRPRRCRAAPRPPPRAAPCRSRSRRRRAGPTAPCRAGCPRRGSRDPCSRAGSRCRARRDPGSPPAGAARRR